jgi:CheY-like chemotaxis protein
MSFLVVVVDDESDVEMLFRQQFRRDLRDNRFRMDFAQSAASALQRLSDAAGESLILILSDINMLGMSGLELLPKAKAARPDVPVSRRACRMGFEGIVSKRLDAPYRSGPSKSWLKSKNPLSEAVRREREERLSRDSRAGFAFKAGRASRSGRSAAWYARRGSCRRH